MNLSNINAIIFDLGGVILNIDYHRTIAAFRALGMADFDRHFTQLKQEHLFDLYETGQITNALFRQGLRPHLRPDVTDADIDAAWNAMLLDLPKHRLHLLRQLKNQHRTFLLSNTNAIHINEFHRQLHASHGLMDLNDHFERVYFSFEMGMRKPDPAIFLRVCDENGLNPAETLFIDDSPQHVEGARVAGLKVIHLHQGDILQIFNQAQ